MFQLYGYGVCEEEQTLKQPFWGTVPPDKIPYLHESFGDLCTVPETYSEFTAGTLRFPVRGRNPSLSPWLSTPSSLALANASNFVSEFHGMGPSNKNKAETMYFSVAVFKFLKEFFEEKKKADFFPKNLP